MYRVALCKECSGILEIHVLHDAPPEDPGVPAHRCWNLRCGRFDRFFCGECDGELAVEDDHWDCGRCQAA